MKLSMVAVLLVVAITGCKSNDCRPGDQFMSDDAQRDVWNATNAQAAAGARADGMLRPAHFSDGSLNSLGQEKLELMLRPESGGALPLVVYMNLPADDAQRKSRRNSVESYLVKLGLQAGQFKIEDGLNPAAVNAAAPLIQALPKTDSASSAGETGAAAGSDSQVK